ncbi:MAG: abhydrolase domain-containing protein 6 [Gammaproteobacteria bacterium]|jgi:abhydrolase domain-containing protein 6
MARHCTIIYLIIMAGREISYEHPCHPSSGNPELMADQCSFRAAVMPPSNERKKVIMWIIITIALVLVVGWLALQLFRWPLFNLAMRAQRRRSGLKEKTIRVDGHDVMYLEGGQGEPLVLLHGFGANKDNWSQIAPFLVPHYRLIIPDLPGFGDSTRNADARYGVDEQLGRLQQLIEKLELGAVHLGGNSMGGYFAGLYAARNADAVKSQWLLAPAGVISAQPSEYARCIEAGENPLLVDTPADFARLIEMCFTKVPYVPKVFQRCLCERNVRERSFNEKIFDELFADPVGLEDELNGSRTKTQILWGDNDRILHFSGAQLLGNIIHNAETTVMEKMGHCPMLERPAETAAHYLKFQGVE